MLRSYTCLLLLICSCATHVYAQSASVDTAAINQFIQTRMQRDKLPGLAIAIVKHDRVLFSKGYGHDSNDQSITGNSPFAIASLSKAFTAMAVMQLVDQGKIDLDQPIIHYLPSIGIDDRKSKITVRHLLNQTSGLSDIGFRDMQLNPQPVTTDEALAGMSNAVLETEPGKQFHYHNPNYQLLAILVEKVSNEKFPEYLNQHIFQPLAMTNTWEVTNTASIQNDKRIAKGFSFLLGKPIARTEPTWFVEGAAGVISTTNDMARWLSAQLAYSNSKGDSLLSKKSWKEMITTPSGVSSPYAMGWMVHNNTYHHNGILWTYSSEQVVIPEQDIGIVILFNSGINAYTDYSAYMRGVVDLIEGNAPDTSGWSSMMIELVVTILFLIMFIYGVIRFVRIDGLKKKYSARSLPVNLFFIVLRIVPLLILIFVPELILLLAKRAISWNGIMLMIPGLLISLALVATIELLICLRLQAYIIKKKPS